MTLTLAAAVAVGAGVTALVLALAGGTPLPRAAISLAHPDGADLDAVGWERGLIRWELIRTTIASIAIIAAIGAGLPAAVGLVGLVAPSIWIRIRADAARDRAQRSVTSAIRSIEASLRSGTTLPDALRRALVDLHPATRLRLDAVLRSFDLGTGLDAALHHEARASRDDRRQLVFGTMALGISERLPRERMADLLGSLGGRLAHEDALADEIRARASGARQQQWLLAVLVPAIALFLISTMPTLAAALDTPLGRYVLIPSAITLELGGIFLGRHIVREALR